MVFISNLGGTPKFEASRIQILQAILQTESTFDQALDEWLPLLSSSVTLNFFTFYMQSQEIARTTG
jgi:hypothetical protein